MSGKNNRPRDEGGVGNDVQRLREPQRSAPLVSRRISSAIKRPARLFAIVIATVWRKTARSGLLRSGGAVSHTDRIAVIGFSMVGCSSDDNCAEFGHCDFWRAQFTCHSSRCNVRQLLSTPQEGITDEDRDAVSCNC